MSKLSIIVPIYNVEKYLEKCLESLYQLDLEKEIILVDDESPDDSHKIIKKYKNLFPNETVVVNKKNGGLSSARNAGLKIATGDYISFIDSDDWVDTQKYKKFIESTFEDDLDIGLGNMIYYYESSNQYGDEFFRNQIIKDNKIKTGEQYIIDSYRDKSLRIEVCDDLYKKSFLIENNFWFKEGLLHEDEEFSVKILLKADKVKYYNIPFYIYRQREGSIMQNKSIKNYVHIVQIGHEFLKKISFKNKSEINHILSAKAFSLYKISLLGISELDKNSLEFNKIYKDYRKDYKEVIKNYKNSMNLLAKIESTLIYYNFNLANFIGTIIKKIKSIKIF